jgi:hypothetical protein
MNRENDSFILAYIHESVLNLLLKTLLIFIQKQIKVWKIFLVLYNEPNVKYVSDNRENKPIILI